MTAGIGPPLQKRSDGEGWGEAIEMQQKSPPKQQKTPLQPSLKAVNSRSGRHHKATFSVSALGQQRCCLLWQTLQKAIGTNSNSHRQCQLYRHAMFGLASLFRPGIHSHTRISHCCLGPPLRDFSARKIRGEGSGVRRRTKR